MKPINDSNGLTAAVRKLGVWCGAVISVAVVVGWVWSFLIGQALRPIVDQLDRGLQRDSMIVARLRTMEAARDRDMRSLGEALDEPSGSVRRSEALERMKR